MFKVLLRPKLPVAKQLRRGSGGGAYDFVDELNSGVGGVCCGSGSGRLVDLLDTMKEPCRDRLKVILNRLMDDISEDHVSRLTFFMR